METKTLDLAPLLAARELWLLLSAAAVDPYHRERSQMLRDPGFRRRAVQAARLLALELPEVALGPGEADPRNLEPEKLLAAFDAEHSTLEAAYRQLFGLTAVSLRCPPCETEYEPNTDVTYRSQRLADVAGFYRAFGLQVAARAGERLDHISVEAEFLYLLLAKEAAAREAGNREGAEVCRDARRKFFEEHVGWWLPAFARLLGRTAPTAYYRQLAALAAGLSALERASLGLAPFAARIIPKPSPAEPEGACFECVSKGEDR